MSGVSFSPLDIVDLAVLTAAKLGRSKLSSDGDEAEFYEGFFTAEDESRAATGKDPRKAQRLAAVVAAVHKHAPQGRLLDVGCGLGDTLEALGRLPGLELHGVEYAQASLARAVGRVAGRATVVRGSATELPFDARTFDCLTCVEVLEHISDEERALHEFARVLKPGGSLVITVPHRHWFVAYQRLIGHYRHYDRVSLERNLGRHRFVVVDWLANLPAWHRAADYGFLTCAAASRVATRFGVPVRPDQVHVPGTSKLLLDVLMALAEPLRRREAAKEYSAMPSSTWVVARLESS